jgi:hypothetical protein
MSNDIVKLSVLVIVIVCLDLLFWGVFRTKIFSPFKACPRLANSWKRTFRHFENEVPGPNFMELLKRPNAMTQKISYSTQISLLFLVKKARAEFKSKAIHLTPQFWQ